MKTLEKEVTKRVKVKPKVVTTMRENFDRMWFGDCGKQTTGCCALSQIRAGNNTSIDDIKAALENARKQINNQCVGAPHGIGERAFFAIVSPGEHKLEANLLELGFKHLATFGRRGGYGGGENKFYFININ